MSEWKELTIDDVCTVTDCQHKTAPSVDYITPFKMLRTSNIRNGKIDNINVKYVTEDIYKKWSIRGKLVKDDVILTREAPMGEVGIIKSNEKFFLGQRMLQLKSNKDLILPDFLYYSLLAPPFQNQIRMHDGVGSVVSNLRIPDLKKFKIMVPSMQEQEKLVSILRALDRKIDLNIEMNQTLEQMAMTLYKHWFVEDSGHRQVSIKEFAEIIGGGTPKTSIEEYWNGNIPWISVKDLSSAVIIETEKKITELGLNNSSTKMLPQYSTVISARGTIGNISMIGIPMTMNQSCYAIKANDGLDSFVYYTLKNSIQMLMNKSHGSVFNTITKGTILSLELPYDERISQRFEAKVKGLMEQISSNIKENEKLTGTRDYLLPRLLSGEIDVTKVEKQVEEVL